ncbi:MAG: hypothetical protein U0441_15690 [Polyangiaceae bacterium]
MARLTYTTLVLSLAITGSLSMAACTSVSETIIGSNGGGGSGGSAGTGGTTTADQTGVPCDVGAVFASKCLSCHGAKPSGGAPMSLVTYDELTAASKADATKSNVERSVLRMGDAAAPMPPGANVADNQADIAVLQAWITAGMPKGDCGTNLPPDPFANPAGCLTGQTWPANQEGSRMNPGEACIACHKKEFEAPQFKLAGTVYASGHENDLCYGIDTSTPDYADVRVIITDANGVDHTFKPGVTGNFSTTQSIAFPYKAKVTSSKGERIMNAAQSDGDCNGCHTEAGGGKGSTAPGRIVVPL